MKMLEEGEYDGMAAIYQSVEIDRLNQTLRQHGIVDPELRRAICSHYFKESGRFLDEGWFGYAPWFKERRLYPQICFAEKKPQEAWGEGHISEIETLYVPREGFAFFNAEGGAYTEGNLHWYFDDMDERIEEVERGFEDEPALD